MKRASVSASAGQPTDLVSWKTGKKCADDVVPALFLIEKIILNFPLQYVEVK